jgi:hypothetical protein
MRLRKYSDIDDFERKFHGFPGPAPCDTVKVVQKRLVEEL